MTSSIFATIMASFSRFDLIHFHTEGPCVICWLPRLFGKAFSVEFDRVLAVNDGSGLKVGKPVVVGVVVRLHIDAVAQDLAVSV